MDLGTSLGRVRSVIIDARTQFWSRLGGSDLCPLLIYIVSRCEWRADVNGELM